MSEHEQHQQLPHRYWRTAHRDWRVWVGVFVVAAAMTIYIMSGNLSWWPYN